MNIALITARGGSKGVPRKNIQDLYGVPLISWTISAAKKSACFDRVFVSSDDSEILSISRKWGADVINRPDHLAQDDTSSDLVIQHALDHLDGDVEKPLSICLLQPTSPLRTLHHIQQAVELYQTKGCNVISVCALKPHPAKAYKLNDDGYLVGFIGRDTPFTPRQQLEPAYYPNGAIYIFSEEDFSRENCIPRLHNIPYFMEGWESLDIDDYDDFISAQEYVKKYNYDIPSITN